MTYWLFQLYEIFPSRSRHEYMAGRSYHLSFPQNRQSPSFERQWYIYLRATDYTILRVSFFKPVSRGLSTVLVDPFQILMEIAPVFLIVSFKFDGLKSFQTVDITFHFALLHVAKTSHDLLH